MFLTFTGRDTAFSSIFSQLLIREHIQYCKSNMLICITNVIVVFSSSPGPISVVFPMFSMCFTSLHLFAYSFKHVIQVHYVPSIHLRGQHKSEIWKIGLCSTFKVIKYYVSLNASVKDGYHAFWALGTWGQLFVSIWQHLRQRHPAGTWAIHLKRCWIEGQNR